MLRLINYYRNNRVSDLGAIADISEVGRSSQAYAELGCRTEAMVTDVTVALVDMGNFLQKI